MSMNCRGSFPGVGRTVEVAADIERIQRIWSDCRERFGEPGPVPVRRASRIADAMYAPVVLRFKTYAVQLSPVCRAVCRRDAGAARRAGVGRGGRGRDRSDPRIRAGATP